MRQAQADTAAAPQAKADVLGLALTELTPVQRAHEKVTHGLLAVRVQGVAEREGIARGGIILDVNETPLHSAAQFNRMLAGYGAGHTVALRVKRGGGHPFRATPDPGERALKVL